MKRKRFQLLPKRNLIRLMFGSLLAVVGAMGAIRLEYTGASLLDSVIPENNTLATSEWTPPTAPAFWIEEDTTENEIIWETPMEPDLDGFNIYRSTDGITYGLLTTLTAADTTYLDSALTADIFYYYKVTSFDTIGNENDPVAIDGKFSHTKDLVIDDDSGPDATWDDHNSSGTVTLADPSSWSSDNYVSNPALSASESDAASNAVGGDHYRLDVGFLDPTVSWVGGSSIAGMYDVYASYVCASDRGTADYEVYSGATLLTSTPVTVDQSLKSSDGTACAAEDDIASEAQWHHLGLFAFSDVPEVRLVSVSGTEIRADAVAFHRSGVVAPTHLSPADTATGNSTALTVDWTDVSDDFGPVTYDYERTTDPTFTVVDFSSTGLALSEIDESGLPDGTYYWRVQACNTLAECSGFTTPWSFTVDNSLPGPLLTVINSPEREVQERIKNGGFEDGLDHWVTTGQVNLITGEQDGVVPFDQNMIRIAATPEESVTVLSQDINNGGHGLRSIGFWYNFVNNAGTPSDDPGFMVFLGDEMVHQVWASDVVGQEFFSNGNVGWKYVSLYVADNTDKTFSLAFYPGSQAGSAVYIDNITTNATVVNEKAIFTLKVPERGASRVEYSYILGGELIEGGSDRDVTFSIAGQPEGGYIEYWYVDEFGNRSEAQRLAVIFDNQAPVLVNDLAATDQGNNQYQLLFTAPTDNVFASASRYDIRYSAEEITGSTDWATLIEPERLITDDLPGTTRPPRVSGEEERILLTGLDSGQSLYFAVKSMDAGGNWSDISNVALAEPARPPEIVINEVMYNPVGSDNGSMPDGEWIELYNNSGEVIDLAGWIIRDAANKNIVISSSNSDTNLNLSDGGETVIQPNSWLVVYRNGGAMLNNTGDTISLFNSASLKVDEYTYAGGSTEGTTQARITDGTGEWFAALATPGRRNVAADELLSLEPTSSIWWQEAYNAKFSIFDAVRYTAATYLIEYSHQRDGQIINEGVTGSLKIDELREDVTNIYFATCSSGGECVPHTNVDPSSVKLTVVLSGDGGISDKTLTVNLTGNWPE